MEEIPGSEKTMSGMSLNIDDRAFIKRQNDFIIEFVTEKLDANLRFIADILIANNEKMFAHFDEQKVMMKNIQREITSLKGDVKKIGDRVETLEERIQLIETRLDDYYLRLKNHKHEENEKCI
jgi:seryl-tRNA synthetase